MYLVLNSKNRASVPLVYEKKIGWNERIYLVCLTYYSIGD